MVPWIIGCNGRTWSNSGRTARHRNGKDAPFADVRARLVAHCLDLAYYFSVMLELACWGPLMSVGTGIFLSSLAFVVLVLFLKTKDRWNWKRILIWSMAVIVAVPVAVGGLIYLSQLWQNRPQPQTELWGIRLNDTEADVKFKKGTSTNFVDQKVDKGTWAYAVNGYDSVIPMMKVGDSAGHTYIIRFSNHRVQYVLCVDGDMPTMPNLGGINSYSSLEDVKAVVGKASHVSRSADETERVYSFDRYKVAFGFKGGRMSMVGIYDPSGGAIKLMNEVR